MTDGRLARAGLGQRAGKRRIEKDRVIAEAAVAFRLGRDFPLDRPASLEEDVILLREREGAHKSGATIDRSTIHECR